MTPPAVSREGHLRAFHHVVGYAWRKHLCELPNLCSALQLGTRDLLQLTKTELKVHRDSRLGSTLNAKWLAWNRRQEHTTVNLENVTSVGDASSKQLKVQISDVTTLADERDVRSVISDTDSWVSIKSPSRRVRTNRRSKARERQKEFEQTIRTGTSETPDAGRLFVAIAECLEEDLENVEECSHADEVDENVLLSGIGRLLISNTSNKTLEQTPLTDSYSQCHVDPNVEQDMEYTIVHEEQEALDVQRRLEKQARSKAKYEGLEALLNNPDTQLQDFESFEKYGYLSEKVCPQVWEILSDITRTLMRATHIHMTNRRGLGEWIDRVWSLRLDALYGISSQLEAGPTPRTMRGLTVLSKYIFPNSLDVLAARCKNEWSQLLPVAHDGRQLRGSDCDRCQAEVREGVGKMLEDIRLAFDQMAPLEEYTVENVSSSSDSCDDMGVRDWKDYWSISDDSCASAACNEPTMLSIPITPPPAASEEEAMFVHLRQIQARRGRTD